MCDSVPKRWKSIAMNWMIKMVPKPNINNIPRGSSSRSSPVLLVWNCTKRVSEGFVGRNERLRRKDCHIHTVSGRTHFYFNYEHSWLVIVV
jgi:hypothetical protein